MLTRVFHHFNGSIQSIGCNTEVRFGGRNRCLYHSTPNFLDVQNSYPTEEEPFLEDKALVGVAELPAQSGC